MFGTQSHVLSGQMATEIPAMVESLNQKESEQFFHVFSCERSMMCPLSFPDFPRFLKTASMTVAVFINPVSRLDCQRLSDHG